MNFFIRVPIAVLLGLAAASPALASEWWAVTWADNGMVVFVDTSSIKIVNNRLEYWQYNIYKKATVKGVKSVKEKYSNSCIANKIKSLQVATYADDGSVISSMTGLVSEDDKSLVPGTVGENVHNFVCSTPAIRAKIGFRIATTPELFAYEQQNGEPPPQ